jgi:hypothetical protein
LPGIAKKTSEKKFFLKLACRYGILLVAFLKRHILLRTRQDLRQGVPFSIGICPGMIGAEVKT